MCSKRGIKCRNDTADINQMIWLYHFIINNVQCHWDTVVIEPLSHYSCLSVMITVYKTLKIDVFQWFLMFLQCKRFNLCIKVHVWDVLLCIRLTLRIYLSLSDFSCWFNFWSPDSLHYIIDQNDALKSSVKSSAPQLYPVLWELNYLSFWDLLGQQTSSRSYST